MRKAAVFVVLFYSASAAAASSPLWGPLQPGRYAVGFQQWNRFDYTRPYWMARDMEGKPRTFERARPMRISIWYPAKQSGAPALTLGDYINMMGAEDRLDVPVAEQQRTGRAVFYRFPPIRDLTTEQRAKLEAFPSAAQRNAPPAPGKFPLVLYSLGSASFAHVTPEYLASHGYVVMQAPRLGAFAGLPQDTPDDTDSKVRDTEFVLQAAHDFPSAGVRNLAAIGFSAGGRWALAMAMKNSDVRAVVSLDTVMLFDDAAARNWKQLPFFNLDAVRAPVLHMVRRAWVPQEDAARWSAMRFAERASFVFEDPALDHFDFQGIGYALTLTGARKNVAASVAKTFETFHRYTLAFLDAHLKKDATAAAFLTTARDGVTVARMAAAAAPPSLADVMNAVAEGSVDAAIAAIRRAAPALVAEQTINLAGYNLLGAGRTTDALKMFQLNVDTYPQSANAYDSLADAYVAAGDRAKAIELAKKADAMLDGDPTVAPDRKELIRANIRQKLQ